MFRNIIARCFCRRQGVTKPFMLIKATLESIMKKETKNETLNEWIVPMEEAGGADATETELTTTIVDTVIETTGTFSGLRVCHSFEMAMESLDSARAANYSLNRSYSLPLTPPSTWRND